MNLGFLYQVGAGDLRQVWSLCSCRKQKQKHGVFKLQMCSVLLSLTCYPSRVSGSDFHLNQNHLPPCWHDTTHLWTSFLERHNAKLNANRNQTWNILLSLYETEHPKMTSKYVYTPYSCKMTWILDYIYYSQLQGTLTLSKCLAASSNVQETETTLINWTAP